MNECVNGRVYKPYAGIRENWNLEAKAGEEGGTWEEGVEGSGGKKIEGEGRSAGMIW